MAAPLKLTRTHRILIGVVIAGAVVIAGIGFAGSYAAVRELALKKGFGTFAYFFPLGIDAGICVLLALDLLLTWIRMPFPLLRQTAWLLTVATVAFNAAAASDPLGMGMHAVIPVLFVVTVEAARHAVGRIADITADKHMEGVRITRWLLAPVPTFLLWRRMKLWELRSYDAVIKLEQERLVYQARLRSRFGRGWRRKAPVESLMPLRLARFGVPLAQTAPAGLAAAGIEPQLLPAPPRAATRAVEPKAQEPSEPQAPVGAHESVDTQAPVEAHEPTGAEDLPNQWFAAPQQVAYQGDYDPTFVPEQEHQPSYDAQQPSYDAHQQAPAHEQAPVPPPRTPEPGPQVPVPNGAGGTRPLGTGTPEAAPQPAPAPAQAPAAAPTDEDLYQVFRHSIEGEGMPTPGAFAANLDAQYGIRLRSRELNRYMDQFSDRLNAELMDEHIA
ncbi:MULTISPECIES: DUF2637 domain-containing protein [unclassified Streptomyces]|uniref:DUF2637 domain-containing protein n=1 Tax=unclassified Streptomyces TaxID=2593676 RepID=UPI00087F7250|nr:MULTISPECIES: DUF2637 domain-containing protein [unclassified Streptomyces]PBC83287.1 uncharacterized protein DUF2637 [Streptomyces sp. 2321.6]SDR43673.1 Protein of unknown function [Streptomyces sp. KS_16]SEC91187.1 Protein of unknown function [Streptomyces sp. 2133.1]SNC69365.1 Protein of unknown function [Streptomyces sp. 2114.4]